MNLESSFSLNGDLVMSVSQLRDIYMWGVSVKNADGTELPDSIYEFYIRSAQKELEDILNIKLVPQVIEETRDYNYGDYCTYGFLRCSYPVARPFWLKGLFGQAEQIEYPKPWLSVKRSNEVPEMFYKNLYLIPNQGGYTQGNASGITFNGVFGANLIWRSRSYIPNYWRVRYLTGFTEIPTDLLNVIGMAASINIFHIDGDLILGAGIASFSLGVDGLSQSISSTSSATNAGYGARVLGYSDKIKEMMPILQAKYGGFTVTTL